LKHITGGTTPRPFTNCAPGFQAILDTVRPHLAPREWDRLAAALAIA
jgi:hypothetical protein